MAISPRTVFQHSFDLVAPRADVLMESLRATGYSLPDAVSDLIDNSVAAGARNIWLDFHWAGADSWASILDDGSGMSESDLVGAMRVGSRSPRDTRDPSDLGRYGLGLKTASISQARSLTVATHTAKGNGIRTRRWDLDHLALTGDWQLLNVPVEAIAERNVESLSQLEHGTLVVWEKLDRLVGDAGVDNARAHRQFLDVLRGVEEHVAMVFHRFMAERNAVSIWLNGQVIKPWDPFLWEEGATQRLQSETLGDPEATVVVTPFVLPHHSRLSSEKHRLAGGPAGWNAQQGFYVYRNRRLFLPGDWLGLGFIKEEHYKLARIQLDLSNSSDHEWEIDVRKSRARPPLPLKEDLRRIAQAVRKRAVTVYRHRGKTLARTARESPVFVWQRHVRGNRVSYVVNRGHPLIRDALGAQSLDSKRLQQILRLVEEYIPVQQVWVDMAEGDESQSQPFESAADQEIADLIRALYSSFIAVGLTHQDALDQLGSTEAIGNRFELVEPTVNALLKESGVE
ncbi:MAG: ATP-binding protein [Chloroflexi bacterium]|nr:ATP-binding protein [Chloroflexota bacterium]